MADMEVSTALPRIDEHEILVDVSAEEAWPAVLAVFERLTAQPLWRVLAKVIHCTPDHASGSPALTDAAVPGFRVTRSLPPNEWALEGRHLFSRYALTFRVIPIDDRHCRIGAESSAEFPGHRGTVYRFLVIGSGCHVLGVRGILRSIKTRAECPPCRSSDHP